MHFTLRTHLLTRMAIESNHFTSRGTAVELLIECPVARWSVDATGAHAERSACRAFSWQTKMPPTTTRTLHAPANSQAAVTSAQNLFSPPLSLPQVADHRPLQKFSSPAPRPETFPHLLESRLQAVLPQRACQSSALRRQGDWKFKRESCDLPPPTSALF
jgi:hypothetical protein